MGFGTLAANLVLCRNANPNPNGLLDRSLLHLDLLFEHPKQNHTSPIFSLWCASLGGGLDAFTQ
jgi:hypothetical protein